MKRMRLVLVAAVLCLAVLVPLAGPAYASGDDGYSCPGRYSCANGYQYAGRYPDRYQHPYQNRYSDRYQHFAPVRPEPPHKPYYVPGLTTAFGDYTRCAQYRIHQANCFVPNEANSPNLGSIQMEPQIQIWGNCSTDQTMDRSGKKYQCSKTEAGWFPL